MTPISSLPYTTAEHRQALSLHAQTNDTSEYSAYVSCEFTYNDCTEEQRLTHSYTQMHTLPVGR